MMIITDSINYSYYNCPFGYFKIGCTDTAVVSITVEKNCDNKSNPSPLALLANKELQEYLDGERKSFDFPIKLQGTPFQLKVYEALLAIPYGETRSYKDIAVAVGSPKACRAVGMANNRNPIVIAVPCHRVIGADGRLVGYGCGLMMKETLLNLEAANCSTTIA